MYYQVVFSGIVQGVGFRPFLYQAATATHRTGEVYNQGSDVISTFSATSDEDAAQFVANLLATLPATAQVETWKFYPVSGAFFENFSVRNSLPDQQRNSRVPPDVALCDACLAELQNPTDRRFGYSYLGCATCGPRYSVMEQLPFDRAVSSMKHFDLCSDCGTEYTDPTNRRFHAQLNSCGSCGIRHTLYRKSGNDWLPTINNEVETIANALRQGNVVAVKGIGGFLLLCDATNEKAVEQLRQRKHRPTKPFAVLYPDIQEIMQQFEVSLAEQEALQSAVAPIVLLRPKRQNSVASNVYPHLNRVGVLLPYAPLLWQIANAMQRPLVATSGNISGSPIVADGQVAKETLSDIADWILDNDRAIVQPQDDSVVRFTHTTKRQIILRRSRGLAPNFRQQWQPTQAVWGFGAMQKSTFCFQLPQVTFISPYVGDLASYLSQQHFTATQQRASQLLPTRPAVIVADAHEGYASTQIARELADAWQVPFKQVHHHEAHFWAILGEHQLTNSEQPILGFIWDGTGLGTDGQIWGGEWFIFERKSIRREGHLAYFPYILGDKMAKEPRISAFCLVDKGEVDRHFNSTEQRLYAGLKATSKQQCSSMGRLFDAVACVIIGITTQTFEGEAAMQLEVLAEVYYLNNPPEPLALPLVFDEKGNLSGSAVLETLHQQISLQVPPEKLAFQFHLWLVEAIKYISNQLAINNLCFSGGVFQNALLVDLIEQQLAATHQLYFHEQLSPNDENISYGQTIPFSLP